MGLQVTQQIGAIRGREVTPAHTAHLPAISTLSFGGFTD